MDFSRNICALSLIAFLLNTFREVDAVNYASVKSRDGNFKLQWTFKNNKLIFNMTCKTTGWCAVGFTTTADGRNMVNYDSAVGGVASNTTYLDGYQSTMKGTPTKDPTPDYNLIKASEENGYTSVEFDRSTTTEKDDKDVQFMSDTEVWIVWAWRNNDDASSGLNGNLKHSVTGISTKKYNLIKDVMNPSTTKPKVNAAIQPGSPVLHFVLLALLVCASASF